MDAIPYIPTSFLRLFTNSQQNAIKFETCTDYDNDGKKWCATKVTSDNKYVNGFWGECSDTLNCNTVEGKDNFYVLIKCNKY